jgi:hypothetical protein
MWAEALDRARAFDRPAGRHSVVGTRRGMREGRFPGPLWKAVPGGCLLTGLDDPEK